MSIRSNYNHTLYACYTGYITQAVVNNFVPLLFLTFQSTYGIPLSQITLLITVNFVVQLLTDIAATKFVDRIGYRASALIAHIFAAAGLIGIGILPELFPSPFAGLLVSVAFHAVGGGLIEVIISPIVEACPTSRKAAAMSLLHSFYCWGSVFVVLLSTVFFSAAGIQNWKIMAFLWALIPIANTFYFSQVPIAALVEKGEGMGIRQLLGMKLFWIFGLLMLCSGASELAMSQWASAFAESGLKVSKTAGDLAGPCLFAVLMGSSRVFYAKFSEKIRLANFMAASGVLCVCRLSAGRLRTGSRSWAAGLRAVWSLCRHHVARNLQPCCRSMSERRNRHVRFVRPGGRSRLYHRPFSCGFGLRETQRLTARVDLPPRSYSRFCFSSPWFC